MAAVAGAEDATAAIAAVVAADVTVVAAVAAASACATELALPAGIELTTLGDGLRVVTENVPSVRSVALGMWVRTGSRDEQDAQAGVSHFLEHLLFKGTERHSAIEISELWDGLGAATNAATSKESTHLYARFLDEHTEEAFELMAEMLLDPALPPDEIDSEREVVLEEIAMYEDEPSDRVHDVLAEAIHGEHPLGRRVLGRADVIASIPVPDIAGYHDTHYVAPNIVVAAAGHVDHERIVELATGKLGTAGAGAPASVNGGEPDGGQRLIFYPKDTEQYHICFGGPGIPRADERRFALAILDSIFGGSVSSRLFREVREKRGLAYSVGSYTDQYIDRGVVAMYVGTRADNVAESCEIIGRELVRLSAEGVTEDELARAKEHVKGRMVLGLEATASRMARIARGILFDVPLLSLDEMLAEIDAVTSDDVAELAKTFYDPTRLAAACVGPDEECFRTAAGQVSEALVA
ncbi:MAG TPA: pitrilysin family protein [Solirubrobacterales bacterium]|nr:pitrilysin family protein [Solirubrobacterales bacterium]